MRCAWALLGAAALVGAMAPAAQADDPISMRPLGSEVDAARSLGIGHWAVEAGGLVPTFDALAAGSSLEDQAAYARQLWLPAYPQVRAAVGLAGDQAAFAYLGPWIGGAWRRPFLRADAPWPGEALQAHLQVGGGYHWVHGLPMAFGRAPVMYVRGPFTLHGAGGGYYLFNQQPIAEGQLGMEWAFPWGLSLGATARLRMDVKKLNPQDGAWSFGGGLRWQVGEAWQLTLEGLRDEGPPSFTDSKPLPRLEFPQSQVRLGLTYVGWRYDPTPTVKGWWEAIPRPWERP